MSEYLVDLTSALLQGLLDLFNSEVGIYAFSLLIFVIVWKLIFRFLLLK